MEVLLLSVELHIPQARSLKAKRSVVLSAVRTLDNWKGVGVAEVGHLDTWQRSRLGVAIVGGSVSHLTEVADAVERYLWSLPGAEVIDIERTWAPMDD